MDTVAHCQENANASAASALCSVSAQAPSAPAQLALPTGPITLLRGGGRERTDKDRAWYSNQLSVEHGKRIDKLVFERMAFYGSLNPERIAYPSVKRLSDEALCSERSVRYALRRLESSGLVECVSPGYGRSTSRYRVVGSSPCRSDLQTVQVRPANGAPKVLKEGKNKGKKEKALSVSVSVQTQDHGEKDKSEAGGPSLFPSLSQEQEKASAPVTGTRAVYRAIGSPKVVALWCALCRKLGIEVNPTKETEFDKRPHSDRTHIINELEARERALVHQGRVSPPPIKKPESTGYVPIKAVAAADLALHRAACQHVPAGIFRLIATSAGSTSALGSNPPWRAVLGGVDMVNMRVPSRGAGVWLPRWRGLLGNPSGSILRFEGRLGGLGAESL